MKKRLQKSLALRKATKSITYVSKEDAAQVHANEIGEDFMSFLGYNPLLNSLDVYFNADFVSPEFLSGIKTELEEKNYINEIVYDQPLLEILDENIKKITQWIILLSSVFILVAILLINSSIRLSIYSKRLIIKTMQLVGATKRFIRRPFIFKHLQLGLLGSVIALSGLTFLLYELNLRFPELNLMQNPIEIGSIYAFVLGLGILITALSTFFATQRFLNLTTDAVN